MSGDHDQFCSVIIQFQKVVGHPYLYILDTDSRQDVAVSFDTDAPGWKEIYN